MPKYKATVHVTRIECSAPTSPKVLLNSSISIDDNFVTGLTQVFNIFIDATKTPPEAVCIEKNLKFDIDVQWTAIFHKLLEDQRQIEITIEYDPASPTTGKIIAFGIDG